MEYFENLAIDMNSLVIIMSYSLWDLVSATIEHILGASYSPPILCRPSAPNQSRKDSLKLPNVFTPC